MSTPHNFSDDPHQFPGPPAKSNNTKIIVVAIAVIGGTLMLICGGIIFGLVMTVRQAQDQFETVMADQEWDVYSEQSAYQGFTELTNEGRYAEAVEDIDASLEDHPDNAFLHNNKAWLLATCTDESVRDGEAAVEHANKACELTAWRNFAYVDTLAAAHAESGDFESAVEWQEKAIQLADNAYLRDFQRRLRLFKAGKAYREGVPPYEEMTDETVADETLVEQEATVESDGAIESTTTDETTTE